MAKKKRKVQKAAPQPLVRLSQCMIVKNEEKNIEKALSWGKGIVCEQIVVDTGSTDRTVETAGRMGAKVLHFQWINDFAAAKNYALEQAAGNWIAFLDADEYFPKEDAAKLLPILKQIMTRPEMKSKCLAIGCPMHQLDDEGRTQNVNVQVRLFRNLPKVRYRGRIHEELSIGAPDIIRTEDIRIMHTGYSKSAYIQSGKSKRNIEILRSELAQRPDDLRLKLYLADSLISYSNVSRNSCTDKTEASVPEAEASACEAEANVSEAEALYKEVALGDTSSIDPEFQKTAYRYLLNKYSGASGVDPEYEQICLSAQRDFPDDHKIMCLSAAVLNNKQEYRAALDILQKLEAKQSDEKGRSFAYSVTDMMLMYTQMVYAAQGLGDLECMIKYTAMMAALDKTNTNVLGNYIKLLLRRMPSAEDVLEILAMTYDLSSREDTALITAAAEECGANALVERIKRGVS